MMRMIRISVLSVLVLFCSSASAQAWRWFGWRSYYYAPVYYPAYVVPACPTIPPQYATPKPAPASETSEPPLDTSKPRLLNRARTARNMLPPRPPRTPRMIAAGLVSGISPGGM